MGEEVPLRKRSLGRKSHPSCVTGGKQALQGGGAVSLPEVMEGIQDACLWSTACPPTSLLAALPPWALAFSHSAPFPKCTPDQTPSLNAVPSKTDPSWGPSSLLVTQSPGGTGVILEVKVGLLCTLQGTVLCSWMSGAPFPSIRTCLGGT